MKKSKKSKAVVYIIILGILIAGGLYWKFHKNNTSTPFVDSTEQTRESATPSISIGSIEIKEKNFTGKVATIEGESELAKKSQAYIDGVVAEFKKRADTEVPDMLEEFGSDSPSANYEIGIDAKDIKSAKTESVAMLIYEYTGGAHGNSLYKVITASSSLDKILSRILSLSDVIKKDKQSAFTEVVKNGLMAWRPYESTDTVVFPEDVQGLKFDSFANWSLDEENLILYFAQYEIGPGVLGPVAFPVPIEKIKDFLQ